MFVLDPSMLLVDFNQAQVVHVPASSSTKSPAQQTIDPSSVMGGKVNSSNNEGYIYISQNLVPPGWKLMKYQVNWNLRDGHLSTESPEPSLWSKQTGFYVRKIKNNVDEFITTCV